MASNQTVPEMIRFDDANVDQSIIAPPKYKKSAMEKLALKLLMNNS